MKKNLKCPRKSHARPKNCPQVSHVLVILCRFGPSLLADKAFALDCFPDLVAQRVFPTAKDVTESFAALNAAQRHSGKGNHFSKPQRANPHGGSREAGCFFSHIGWMVSLDKKGKQRGGKCLAAGVEWLLGLRDGVLCQGRMRGR